MTNRRHDTSVALAGIIDEIAAAALHLLFDHATPTDAMIDQLAVPLVVIESNLALFESLFGRLAITKGFAAVQLVEFAFAFGVPGIEQFARVASLGLAIGLAFVDGLLGLTILIFLFELVGNFDLLFRLVHGEGLKQ